MIIELLVTLALSQGLTPRPPGQAGQTRTNYALQSSAMTNGAGGYTAPWNPNSSTNTDVAGSPVGGTWAEVTNQAAGGGPYMPVNGSPTPSTERKITLSAYLAKASGTGYASLVVGCGAAPDACSCWRSDGGSCSATVHSTNYCRADVTNLGTTEIRLAVFATCPSDQVSHEIVLIPGQVGVAVGTTRFAGVMLEVGARTKPSKYCATTTAAKTCK